MEIPEVIGANIRMFRKLHGLSQEELAAKIFKSKSVFSKYELGQASVDVVTLCKIADALDIDPSLLLRTPFSKSSTESVKRYGLFTASIVYLIMYIKPGGYWKGLISLQEAGDKVNATMYIQIPNYSDYTKCRAVYTGTLSCFPTNAYLYMHHQTDTSDIFDIYTTFSKGSPNVCSGLAMQIAYLTGAPTVGKILLSNRPFLENDELLPYLTAGKDDLAVFKRSSLFAAHPFVREQALFNKQD